MNERSASGACPRLALPSVMINWVTITEGKFSGTPVWMHQLRGVVINFQDKMAKKKTKNTPRENAGMKS